MFGLFSGKAPREAHERMAELFKASAMHMFMQVNKSGDAFRPTHHKTFDLTSDAERAKLRETFLMFWGRFPKNRDNWMDALRYLDKMHDQKDVDPYEIGAAHMIFAIIKADYACEFALRYPRDREMLDAAHKLVAVNGTTLAEIICEHPSDHPFDRVAAGISIMNDLVHCRRVNDAFMGPLWGSGV